MAAAAATRMSLAVVPGVATQRPRHLGTALPSRGVRRAVQHRRPSIAVRAVLPGAADSVPSAVDHLAAQLTPLIYTLADAGGADAVASNPNREGFFAPLANAMEGFLEILDSGLESAHVPYSYGFAIILLTVLVKAATFPLSKKQVESTMAMQTLQPRIKELQERYKNDQERLQMETARLYKDAGVNPLAGCLPTLATIPVFIGLYRALSNAADDGLLTEGFFWIPSLGGPTTIAARNAGAGSNWLFPFVDGHPPMGWHDTLAYLVLPVLLVISQFASTKIMQPQTQSDDPATQQTQAILKFLPLMIGWFSLNVPSGLTLYWLTNNILSTAQSVFLKRNPPELVTAMAEDIPMGSTTIVKDESEKKDKKKKSKTGKEMGSRRSKKGDKFRELKAKENGGASTDSKGKGKKGATFAALKAAEEAASQAKATNAEIVSVEAEVVSSEKSD